MAHSGPGGVMSPLRTDDLGQLLVHQLAQDTQPEADRERHQALPGRPDQLPEGLFDPCRERLLGAHARGGRYVHLHGGSSVSDLPRSLRTPPTGADGAEGPPSSSSTGYGTTSSPTSMLSSYEELPRVELTTMR